MDHAFHAGIAAEIADEAVIHAGDEIHALTLDGIIGGDIAQVFDGKGFAIEWHGEPGALMNRGQEGGAVFASPTEGGASLDADESGQIRILGAEAVADPRSHGWAHLGEAAGVELQRGTRVLGIISVHATQEAKVICDGGEMRHQIGDHHAALAAWPHGCHGVEREEFLRADLGDFFAQWRVNLLPVSAGDKILRIKQIQLRRATLHEEKDDALCLWHHAREASSEGIGRRTSDVLQRKSTKAAGGALEKVAAGKRVHREVAFWNGDLEAKDELVRGE